MSTVILEGKITVDVTGIENIAAKIRSTTISTLQGEIRHLAEQILRDLAHADWPAGKASKGYVSTGELADKEPLEYLMYFESTLILLLLRVILLKFVVLNSKL